MSFLLQFFMNPLFLIGVSSASIPIVIHLIHRRKAPKLLFSTLRFLRVSNERTARRQHLQDIRLLLLRALICALLAVALARPFLPASGALSGPVTAAIVLDNSLSMSAEDEGRARFTAAKETALEVLRSLGNQASALLVLTNPPRENAMTAPVSDLGLVQREIANSEVSAGKGDLPATVARARKILDAVDEPNKEIFIISDLQKNSWATEVPKQGEKLSKIPVIVMNCGSKDRSNAGITEVNLRARSRVEGEPVTIEVRLFNFGGKAISQTATLYVDGQSRDRRRVTLAPGVPTAVSFTHVFTQPGVHKGSVVIEDDRLKADNVRSFCISIQEQLKVLIVQDEVAAVDFHDDSFYLIRALDPLAGVADVRSPIHPVTITADRLQGEKLSDYRAVFLVNLTHISQPAAAELKQYVRGGRPCDFRGRQGGRPHLQRDAGRPRRCGVRRADARRVWREDRETLLQGQYECCDSRLAS